MSNNDRSEEIYIIEDDKQMSEREYMQHLIDSNNSWTEYAKQVEFDKKYLIISMNEINKKVYMRAIKIILLIFSGILVLSIGISIAYSCI
jgi:hypothetical protein